MTQEGCTDLLLMAELLAALRADEPDRFKRWFLVQKCLGRPNEEL